MNWATIERHVNNIEESKAHIRKAYDLSKRLTPGPNTDNIIEEIKIYETQVNGGIVVTPNINSSLDTPE